jgi:hypothetical protein
MGIGWMGSISHSLFSSALLGPAIPWSPRNDRYGHKKKREGCFSCLSYLRAFAMPPTWINNSHSRLEPICIRSLLSVHTMLTWALLPIISMRSKLRSLRYGDNFKTLFCFRISQLQITECRFGCKCSAFIDIHKQTDCFLFACSKIIGTLTVSEVMSKTRSLCKVTKGGEAVLSVS